MKENFLPILPADVAGKKIAIAVSGGVDSMVLLDWFFRNVTSSELVVLHIEHGIRGAESCADMEFVAKQCKKRGIEFFCKQVDVPKFAKEQKFSIETAARLLRRREFLDFDADYIALAHHADDNAESILMHILRGTGLKGACGMQAHGGGRIIRPFIKISRKQIEEYQCLRKVEFVEDLTNADTMHTRNFIRHEVMPVIQKKYPQAVLAINKFAENASDYYEHFDSFTTSKVKATTSGAIIPIECKTDDRTVNHINIAKALSFIGIRQDVEKVHYDSVASLWQKGSGKQVDLPHFATAKRTKAGIEFSIDVDKLREKNERVNNKKSD